MTNRAVLLTSIILITLAGCTAQPESNPVWCPPEPFHMEGPVTIMVGYGTVWASNATGVYRFTVAPDTEDARFFCEDTP